MDKDETEFKGLSDMQGEAIVAVTAIGRMLEAHGKNLTMTYLYLYWPNAYRAELELNRTINDLHMGTYGVRTTT